MTLRQRQPRVENPGFLAFVRTQRCCVCGAPPQSQAAHLRMGSIAYDKRWTGMSEKPDDRWANPLCQECHLDAPGAQHRVGEAVFWTKVGLDPFALALGLYKAFAASSIAAPPPRKHSAHLKKLADKRERARKDAARVLRKVRFKSRPIFPGDPVRAFAKAASNFAAKTRDRKRKWPSPAWPKGRKIANRRNA